MRRVAILLSFALTELARGQPAPEAKPVIVEKAEPRPWRIDKAVNAPAWLELGLEQQSRYEHLSHDYRGKSTSDASGFLMRTLLSAEASIRTFVTGLEVEDSRMYASDATPLNTTLVDTWEILQAYAGVGAASVFTEKDKLDARVGRITIDLSTRRLVARNRFRNTINGFTGVDAKWTSPRKHLARAFVAVPVNRLPADAEALKANKLELDEENTDALLWSGYYGSPALASATQIELYVVGFHERDGDIASRNRRIYTAGARWFRIPAPGALDVDLEVVPQIGKSRATTTMEDTIDLDHRALTTHAEVGISPRIPSKPRIALMHDYASGDRAPTDGSTERFDPLFGARRFDFGPTGIYGPINRSNIQSPGIRISIAPTDKVDAFVTYRLFWLASRKDAWVAANVRDSMGTSGNFVGEHVELQLRWTPFPKNLSLEVGAAYLRRGEFAKSAPDTRQANPAYAYSQVTVNL